MVPHGPDPVPGLLRVRGWPTGALGVHAELQHGVLGPAAAARARGAAATAAAAAVPAFAGGLRRRRHVVGQRLDTLHHLLDMRW